MKPDLHHPSARVRLAGLVVLLIGVLSAASVFFVAATDNGTDALGYRVVGGQAYAIPDDASSREMQQLARLGGTASVMTFKFDRWFVSLWSGRRLALTLLVLTAVVCAFCFYIAGLMDETGST